MWKAAVAHGLYWGQEWFLTGLVSTSETEAWEQHASALLPDCCHQWRATEHWSPVEHLNSVHWCDPEPVVVLTTQPLYQGPAQRRCPRARQHKLSASSLVFIPHHQSPLVPCSSLMYLEGQESARLWLGRQSSDSSSPHLSIAMGQEIIPSPSPPNPSTEGVSTTQYKEARHWHRTLVLRTGSKLVNVAQNGQVTGQCSTQGKGYSVQKRSC